MSADNHSILSEYVQQLIRIKARQLARRPGFTRSDEEDLRQELTLRLLQRARHYDPARASLNTFAERVVRSLVATLLREQRRQKSVALRGTVSLEIQCDCADDGASSLRDLLQDADHARRVGGAPSDVDLERRLIHVRAKTIGEEFWQPKTKRNRVVPISGALAEILKAYEPPGGSKWFFPSPTGKRWHPDNFSQDLKAANQAAGLPWGCLDFRHTFGSQLAQRGESLFKIATLMGNSPEICRRHYAALVPEAMHDSVEFGNDRSAPGGDESVRLLREVLNAVRGGEGPDDEKPRLRIVRDDAG